MARIATNRHKAELITRKIARDVQSCFLQNPKVLLFTLQFFHHDTDQLVNLVPSHVQILYKPIVLCFPGHCRRADYVWLPTVKLNGRHFLKEHSHTLKLFDVSDFISNFN